MHILEYIWTSLVGTAVVLFVLLGPGLLLALIMNMVAAFVERRAYGLLGKRLFLTLFGWLGTIVHESGHALFCVLFGHKITQIKLFDPSHHGGSLGSVSHSFNPRNPYHLIGNFFIGIGPIILGAAVIYWSSYLLLGKEVTQAFNSVQMSSDALLSTAAFSELGGVVWGALSNLAVTLVSSETLLGWKFYVFVYIAFSVGSSITLSRSDIHGAQRGFLALALILFVAQLCTLWMGDHANQVALSLGQLFAPFYVVLLFALVVHAVAAVFLWVVGLFLPG